MTRAHERIGRRDSKVSAPNGLLALGSRSSGAASETPLFYLRVDGLEERQCRVYRVQQAMGNKVIGGCTVIARRLIGAENG
jgi:hypothetical protein